MLLWRGRRGTDKVRLATGLLLVAMLAMAQSGDALRKDPHVQRVGAKLRCLCGCPLTVANCDMARCGYADPARERIVSMAGKGQDDNMIVASFTQAEGLRALSAPPTQGFYLWGWVMPFAALLGGMLMVAFAIRKYAQRPAPVLETPSGKVQNRKNLDKYQDQIDRDLAAME